MSDQTTPPAGDEQEPPRVHPQDPAEGADPSAGEDRDEPRVRPQDPAEGSDDAGATR